MGTCRFSPFQRWVGRVLYVFLITFGLLISSQGMVRPLEESGEDADKLDQLIREYLDEKDSLESTEEQSELVFEHVSDWDEDSESQEEVDITSFPDEVGSFEEESSQEEAGVVEDDREEPSVVDDDHAESPSDTFGVTSEEMEKTRSDEISVKKESPVLLPSGEQESVPEEIDAEQKVTSQEAEKKMQVNDTESFIDTSAGDAGFQAEIEEEISRGPGTIYEFHEHLASAQTAIIHEREGYQAGVWEEDRFVFLDYGAEDDISVKTGIFNGVRRRGIYFHPVRGAKKRLRFFHVPPGRKLVIHYGIHDFGVSEDVKAHCYVKIWVGNHQLGKIRVANEKGWKVRNFELGVVEFLKQAVVVTFELTADEVKGRNFFFRPEIQ